jgi:hypothetical protein
MKRGDLPGAGFLDLYPNPEMYLDDSLSGLFGYNLHSVDIATGWEATGACSPFIIHLIWLLF